MVKRKTTKAKTTEAPSTSDCVWRDESGIVVCQAPGLARSAVLPQVISLLHLLKRRGEAIQPPEVLDDLQYLAEMQFTALAMQAANTQEDRSEPAPVLSEEMQELHRSTTDWLLSEISSDEIWEHVNMGVELIVHRGQFDYRHQLYGMRLATLFTRMVKQAQKGLVSLGEKMQAARREGGKAGNAAQQKTARHKGERIDELVQQSKTPKAAWAKAVDLKLATTETGAEAAWRRYKKKQNRADS
ncbi:MAG: hypothetical protein ACK5UC_06770 [Planctomycetaceae bacterium]